MPQSSSKCHHIFLFLAAQALLTAISSFAARTPNIPFNDPRLQRPPAHMPAQQTLHAAFAQTQAQQYHQEVQRREQQAKAKNP